MLVKGDSWNKNPTFWEVVSPMNASAGATGTPAHESPLVALRLSCMDIDYYLLRQQHADPSHGPGLLAGFLVMGFIANGLHVSFLIKGFELEKYPWYLDLRACTISTTWET
jgi:hypothetical protein